MGVVCAVWGLCGERFTASAYCQARQRLPLELLRQLVNQFGRQLDASGEPSLWHGYRVLLEDGSGFSMPDTPELQAFFGQPGNQKPGCGFPVAHPLALFDAQAGFLRDVMVFPLRTQDIAHAADLHPKLTDDDVIVGDRGFCSYAHLALVLQAKLHAVFRVHQIKIVDFHPHRFSATKGASKGRPRSRWIRRLGVCDQLVEWFKPATRPKWMTVEHFAQLLDKMLVRELKWRIREPNRRVQEIINARTNGEMRLN